MAKDKYYRANSPQVVHEVIDGEAVLINMVTGAYYSIDKVGADIWTMVAAGDSADRVVKGITANYEGDLVAIEAGVERLLDELCQEGLVVVAEAPTRGAEPIVVRARESETRPKFETPVLHKYTDMTELLLLDPIHEVDEMGWPHPPANAQ